MEYMENNNNKFLIVEAALKSFFFQKRKKIQENVRISTRCAQSVWPKGRKKTPIFKITHFD
jgi:ribosomal protein L31E